MGNLTIVALLTGLLFTREALAVRSTRGSMPFRMGLWEQYFVRYAIVA